MLYSITIAPSQSKDHSDDVAYRYDVTNIPADRILEVLAQDWMHLVYGKRILESASYLRDQGRPVIALWGEVLLINVRTVLTFGQGFGFEDAGHTPELVRSVARFFRKATPGSGVYLMAGTPTYWRTSDGDADRDPGFVNVWLEEFDAISPWTVARYNTEEEADIFADTTIRGDVELVEKRNKLKQGQEGKIDYIPVVHPGTSVCCSPYSMI
mgnify:CR=1 FL=1